jgi:hypothetical protein
MKSLLFILTYMTFLPGFGQENPLKYMALIPVGEFNRRKNLKGSFAWQPEHKVKFDSFTIIEAQIPT